MGIEKGRGREKVILAYRVFNHTLEIVKVKKDTHFKLKDRKRSANRKPEPGIVWLLLVGSKAA